MQYQPFPYLGDIRQLLPDKRDLLREMRADRVSWIASNGLFDNGVVDETWPYALRIDTSFMPSYHAKREVLAVDKGCDFSQHPVPPYVDADGFIVEIALQDISGYFLRNTISDYLSEDVVMTKGILTDKGVEWTRGLPRRVDYFFVFRDGRFQMADLRKDGLVRDLVESLLAFQSIF